MKFEIKNRFNGNIIFSFESSSFKICVETAIKAKIDLSGSDLRWSDLSGSDLSGSDLRGSDLRGSDLRWSDLSGSDLRWSDLSGSDLRWSDLSGSDLSGSDLSGSDLRGSNLRGSDLSGSNLWLSHFRAFTVAATTTHLQIGCENHDWSVWLNDAKRSEIAQKNNDNGDFEGFWQICLTAKAWLDLRFKK